MANKDDADANPSNEIQSLEFVGDTLKISYGNQIVFPYDNSGWTINGNKLYYNAGNAIWSWGANVRYNRIINNIVCSNGNRGIYLTLGGNNNLWVDKAQSTNTKCFVNGFGYKFI